MIIALIAIAGLIAAAVAYRMGYRDGYDMGYEIGHYHGLEDGDLDQDPSSIRWKLTNDEATAAEEDFTGLPVYPLDPAL